MKKTIILLVGILLFAGCASLVGLEQPKAELAEVFARDVNLSGVTLVFVVEVENPNTRALKLDEVTYKVFVGGKEFTAAQTDKKINIPAQGKALVEVPLPVRYSQLLSSVGEILLNQH